MPVTDTEGIFLFTGELLFYAVGKQPARYRQWSPGFKGLRVSQFDPILPIEFIKVVIS